MTKQRNCKKCKHSTWIWYADKQISIRRCKYEGKEPSYKYQDCDKYEKRWYIIK